MTTTLRKFLYILFLLLPLCSELNAQSTLTLSGTIKDAKTGEELIGAAVIVKELPNTAVLTNIYGFYSVTIPNGKYTLLIRYIGYTDFESNADSLHSQTINIKLSPSSTELKSVEVTAKKSGSSITNTEVGVTHLDIKELNKVPVIFGEKDILKTLQLLPGVQPAGDGNSGFYVRGGSADQNMVLLDGSTVYNPGHVLGFFSAFNSEAIKNATLYKGNVPAEFGGRLSSVLDMQMKEGNYKDYVITGGIGLISSKLSIEGPIKQDKGSFIITGRRTYADLFLKASSNPTTRSSEVYFYDITLKANYRIGDHDHIFVSGYFGRDALGLGQTFNIKYGNIIGSARWNHVFSDKVFSNTSFIFNNYNNKTGVNTGDLNATISSSLKDYGLKENLEYFLNSKNKLKFGFSSTLHTIAPGIFTSADSTMKSSSLAQNFGWENAIYAQHEISLGKKVNINYGLRLSTFTITGPGDFYNFNSNGGTDTIHFKVGQFGKTYINPEPRFALSYNFQKNMSLKVAYSRNTQNLHLLTNSVSSSPTDRWLLNTNNIKPEISDQASLGYYVNFYNNMFEMSVEGYYKYMQNQIDYKVGAQLSGNGAVESQLLYGIGRSYGAEFFFKKAKGKFTGWVSYTLARSERSFNGINDRSWFLTPYDRTHDLNVVAMYEITPRINVSAAFAFYTGQASTFPVGKYSVQGQVVPLYSNKNQDRFPPYHRLDLSATFVLKKRKNWEHDLSVSIYNVYARKNAYSIAFVSQNNVSVARETYLYTIIPSVTYNFKFLVPRKIKSN